MKHAYSSKRINTARLILAVVCLIMIIALTFSLFACSGKKSDSQSQSETTETPDTTPDDNPPSGDEPGDESSNEPGGENNPQIDQQTEHLNAFIAAMQNVNNTDATTTVTVSFGGRILSQKTISYTRTDSGGSIMTTTTTLADASAKNPYTTTTDAPENLSASDFESRFPIFADFVSSVSLENLQFNDDTLSFDLTKENAASLLSLTSADAANIASNVHVVAAIQNATPASFIATYTSSNGNAIEIKVVYSA